MYGGLFGDLPSTKKKTSATKNTDEKNDTTTTTTEAAVETSDSTTEQQQKKKQRVVAASTSSSVVSRLGTAGTSMAFVPTSLRQRSSNISNSKRPGTAPSLLPAATSRSSNTPKQEVSVVVGTDNAASSTTNPVQTNVHDDVMTTQEGVIVETQEKHDEATSSSSSPSLLMMDMMEEESEQLRQLHASVTDMYDPHVPNDLLAYWERKAQEQKRLELERDARETLERQTRLRQQLEQERQAVAATGNVQQIVQHRTERSMTATTTDGRMGRGRGVSNLPAWLVEKQKQQDGLLGASTTETQQQQQQNEQQQGRGSTTVLLCNLTAPGDVDDDLAQEVQEECEETCGKVRNVVIRDAMPPQQPQVHVYVTFAQAAHAQQAARVFHGRQFGQRPITAKLITEKGE